MLYLLPNLLSKDQDPSFVFSKEVQQAVGSIQGLIAESEKEAYRYLRLFLPRDQMDLPLLLLNEHTKDIAEIISEMQKKKVWGLISDAGLPCLADPGASLVLALQSKGEQIKTVGLFSSVTKALLLSGLGGQQFSFHGYPPKDKEELKKKILFWKKSPDKVTHLFIEAPYRSGKLFHWLVELLPKNSFLSVAQNLSSKSEWVKTYRVKDWKKDWIDPKAPTVFTILL